MPVALSLLLALATALEVGTREPLAFFVNHPTGASAFVGASEALATVEGALDAHTNLHPVALPAEPASACRADLPCLAAVARRFGADAGRAPRFLLVLTVVAAGDRDRVAASLVDLEAVAAIVAGGAEAEEAAAAANERAVLARRDWVTLDDLAAFRRFAVELVDVDLRAPFERFRHRDPYARLEVPGVPLGAEVSVDDRTIGLADADPLAIERVPEGVHTVAILHPSLEPYREQVTVRPGDVALLPAPRPLPTGQGLRTATLASGIALGALGAGLLATSVALERSATPIACVGPCEVGLARGLGVPLAPLGVGLALLGGAFIAGAELTPPDEPPWIAWVAGAGALAASVAVGFLVDPGALEP